jgi:mannosidase alpha-like ER degradation enhancer 1
MEYARSLAARSINGTWAIEKGIWDAGSFCEAPAVEVGYLHCPLSFQAESQDLQDYTLTLLFAADNASEDMSPALSKVQPLPEQNAFLVRSIQGLRMQITRRLDDVGGYDITKIGHHRIPSSSSVLLSDPAVMLALRPDYYLKAASQAVIDAAAVVDLNFVTSASSFIATGAKAGFGPAIDTAPNGFLPMALFDISATSNAQACNSITTPQELLGSYALIARRGVCTFAHKMRNAAAAGASALIVLSDEDGLMIPSADPVELVGIAQPVPVVLLPKTESDKLLWALGTSGGEAMLESAVLNSSNVAEVEREDLAATPVVVNGHLLVNCKLVRP